MKNNYRKILNVLFALWLCGGACAAAQAQDATPNPQQVPQTSMADCDYVNKQLGLTDNLNEVTETRDTLTAERAELEQKVIELKGQIKAAPTASQLNAWRKEQADLLAKPNRKDADVMRLAELAGMADSEVKSRETLKDELQAAEAALLRKKGQARCVQQAINSIYSPEQYFKRWMSSIFAALIGFVIIGFFVVSYKDETVRRAIFSGQTGIQFLTLFSIVIAIILFGITSILGDKELSALLGGLSGYILGRHSGSPRVVSPSPEGAGAPTPARDAAGMPVEAPAI